MRPSLSLAVAMSGMLLPLAASAIGIQVMIDGKAVTFVDVPQSAWFAAYVHDATEVGIVNGYEDAYGVPTGKFGPENSVTFAEALKIASESAGYDEAAYGSVIQSGVSHWSSAYVSVAKAENFEVFNHPYRLDRPATRAEVASMIASAFGVETKTSTSGTTFKDVQLSTDFGTSIEALANDDVVSGDTDAHGNVLGTYRPTDDINRAEVVKIAMAARAKYGQPGTGKTPETNTTGSHVVTYMSAGFSPAVLHVPVGTTVLFRNDSANSLQIKSSDDVNLNSGLIGVGAGHEFQYTFTRKGTWSYSNSMNASDTATIVVE